MDKVIPGKCVVTQHKLLVADFCFQVCVRRDRGMKITITMWWKDMYTNVVTCVRECDGESDTFPIKIRLY
jgi:hypothetical protein